jgi:catalase
VKLGALAIQAIEADATCDANTFDPRHQLAGRRRRAGERWMFEIRSPTYAISLTRRAN